MANTLKIQTLIQNIWPGSTTKKAIRHRIPDVELTYSGKESFVAEFTGTGSNYMDVDGTSLTVNGTAAKNPNTDATLVVGSILGFAITVGRAASGTAPTGTAAVNVSSFGKWTTDGNIPMKENSVLVFHNPGSGAAANDETLQVLLSGTTGYKVSVVAWYTPA